MTVVQCMKKSINEDLNFKDAFFKRIRRKVKVKPYDEEHIIFDCYDIAQSLKQKTRTKRAQGKEMEFAIHDEVLLRLPSKTKVVISNILGNALLEEYK